MGQHVVADILAFTQAAAVANHQPDVRTQHRQMVADIFGICRADPNINQRDPLSVFGYQMPGGHLVLFPRQIGNRFLRCLRVRRYPDPARAGEGDIGALGIENLATAPAHELIDVAGVVGKQHIRLEMVNRRAGIVAQARQREIDAAGVEVGKWIVFRRMKQAIGGFIANLRQLGGGEKTRQAGAH